MVAKKRIIDKRMTIGFSKGEYARLRYCADEQVTAMAALVRRSTSRYCKNYIITLLERPTIPGREEVKEELVGLLTD